LVVIVTGKWPAAAWHHAFDAACAGNLSHAKHLDQNGHGISMESAWNQHGIRSNMNHPEFEEHQHSMDTAWS